MTSRENIFLWMIIIVPIGIGLGFVFAPPVTIAQVLGAFVGAALSIVGVCTMFWMIKKLHSGHSEIKS